MDDIDLSAFMGGDRRGKSVKDVSEGWEGGRVKFAALLCSGIRQQSLHPSLKSSTITGWKGIHK